MKYTGIILGLSMALSLVSCGKKDAASAPLKEDAKKVKEMADQYAPVKITADMSHLTEREKKLVQALVEAAKLTDAIFWKQSAHDAISTRDSLMKLNDEASKIYLDYVNINYGPYEVLSENTRFLGVGPKIRPAQAGYYPIDMSKDEFEKYVLAHPDQKEALESQYTVVVRDGKNLKAVPYKDYYPETKKLADKLDEAATYADNETLKTYLKARAQAFRTDNYFDSDMAWMDIKNSNIDVVIGPIENYQDALFNYKTAHEAVVMVKDFEASKELDMFKAKIGDFQARLPIDKKYIDAVQTDNEILQVVNVVYFAGDCQKGTKTIAAALPNDPKVVAAKGGKKSMYKNFMEAKFDKIVKPIGDIIMAPEHRQYVDKKAFTAFVTLHEVSHTLGRGFVFGDKTLTVRKALQERYSGIEECKADILSMFNHKHMLDMGVIDKEYAKKAVATYIAGLYRTMRFGLSSAHGQANVIQFNYLRSVDAIKKNADGTYTYDMDSFFKGVEGLANLVLMTEVTGDYKKAGDIIEKYGKPTEEVTTLVAKLKAIPRDINTTYAY